MTSALACYKLPQDTGFPVAVDSTSCLVEE